MAEVRRRKGKNKNPSASGHVVAGSVKKGTKQTQGSSPFSLPPISPAGKVFGVLASVLYLTGLTVVNPITINRFVRRIIARPCSGICQIPDGTADEKCGPVDADRVVFLRIPKTGSTTVKHVFETLSTNKGVAVHDILELEDLTASLPRPGVPVNTQAYHDPDPRMFRRRMQAYYKKAASTVVSPPYYAQDRDLFEGHLYHFDWPADALKMVGPEPAWMRPIPRLFRQSYGWERPSEQDMARVKEITMVRKPQDRLASMYYYDRQSARTEWWRMDFVEERGNVTLEECLLDPSCVETNELRRWCSVQVELLCGLGKECAKPVGRHALERAKENVKERVLFTGVLERMEESIFFLERLLPTYLEGAGHMGGLPKKKQTISPRRETSFSAEAQAVLDDLCALDNEFYEYVDRLLTERLSECKGP